MRIDVEISASLGGLAVTSDGVENEVMTMNNSAFEKKLNELVNEIGAVPAPQRKKLITLVKKTSDSHKKLGDTVSSLQESLDYLRVSVKYLVFDLEATKRENAELRKSIEGKG